MGQARNIGCSVIHISLSSRSGRLAGGIRRSGWPSVSLPVGGREARSKQPG